MSAAEPDRFFRPVPSASGVFSSWLGVYLDSADGEPLDWSEVDQVLREAYRLIAPKKLIAQMDAS